MKGAGTAIGSGIGLEELALMKVSNPQEKSKPGQVHWSHTEVL